MHRSESIDWLLNYRAVLVENAIRAVRDAPFVMTVPYPAASRRAWQNVPVAAGAWRAVAVAAGAVSAD
ncbi:MAG TPA: hypothetical protein VGA24_09570 [Steroidobacteraceae bacterium]